MSGTNSSGGRPLLVAEGISVRFGALQALNRVSLEVREGEILALIGPNGAGKTTLLNVISGVYRPYEGRILLDGQDLTRLRPHNVAALGVARTFQNVGLFKGMTVLDNLMVGRNLFMRAGFFAQGFYWGFGQKEELEHRRKVEEVIDFLEIQSIRKVAVGMLPYGLQKRVDLGRALAAEPRLLLLDEPMTGMNLEEKEDMSRFILDTNEQLGCTVALIEHDMGVVMDISHRVAVLDYGQKIAEGQPGEIKTNQKVIDAYLGTTGGTRDAVLH